MQNGHLIEVGVLKVSAFLKNLINGGAIEKQDDDQPATSTLH